MSVLGMGIDFSGSQGPSLLALFMVLSVSSWQLSTVVTLVCHLVCRL
jgi:hypothetical protein